jgi:ComF family protein
VCPLCWSSILVLTPPLCDGCGDPLPSWRVISRTELTCPRCRRLPRRVSRTRAIGEYAGSLRAILHALKYDGRRSLARPLAERMGEQGRDILHGAHVVVPVPLHAARRRERGFNQAHDLARHLGLPVIHALRRVRPTTPQVSLAAARRHGNVRGAFRATRAARDLSGAIVVLVDDVSTTGATLEACAQALDEAGAIETRALTAARVVTRPR